MKTVIEMAREAGWKDLRDYDSEMRHDFFMGNTDSLARLVEIVRADERKEIAEKTGEFAKKWWKIHCDSNLHYSSTLKAHQDFCALQVAIRARGQA